MSGLGRYCTCGDGPIPHYHEEPAAMMPSTGTITLYDRNTAHPDEVRPSLEAVYWDYDNQVLIVKRQDREVKLTPEYLIDQARLFGERFLS